jgi:2,4-dichlorophenol 6-monooxygenase
MMNDLPQTFMEPILFKTACSRGTQARMSSTEYLSHVQDDDGVTTTCRDRLSGKELTIRSKYLVGADGGNSKVAEHAGLPFEGQMGVGGSMNIIFKADLSKYVAHRPSRALLGDAAGRRCRRHRHGPGAHGAALERMADRLGLRHQRGAARTWTNEFATKVVRDLVGDQTIEPEITARSHLDGQQHVRHPHAVGPGVHHGRRGAPASALQRAWLEHLDSGCLQPRLETGRRDQGSGG